LRLSATPNGKDHRHRAPLSAFAAQTPVAVGGTALSAKPRFRPSRGGTRVPPGSAGANSPLPAEPWVPPLKTLTASHRQPAGQTSPSAARGPLPAKPRFARRSRRLLAQSPDTASVTQLASLRFAINNARRHPQRMRRRHISFRCRVFVPVRLTPGSRRLLRKRLSPTNPASPDWWR